MLWSDAAAVWRGKGSLHLYEEAIAAISGQLVFSRLKNENGRAGFG